MSDVVHLENVICPYCGVALESPDVTEDHVIARRFVPRGSLNQSWNLHVRACSDCNGRKAALEDRISAASMYAPLVGEGTDGDQLLASEVVRKRQGSKGPRIDRSLQRLSHSTQPIPGVQMTFGIVAPPSVHRDEILELAWHHITALFCMITYNKATSAGAPLPGVFRAIQWSPRSDWGNERHLAFMKLVQSWDHRVWFNAANGFFKALIRRQHSTDCWAWAVEWNTNYRVLGFFGDPSIVAQLDAVLPKLTLQPMGQTSEGVRGVRVERPLVSEDDILFESPPHGERTG